MLKMMTSLSLAAAMIGAAQAQAQPLPAPPTVKYTPQIEAACDTQTLQVYFDKGETVMNAASSALLQAAEATLEGCILGPVSIHAETADAANSDHAAYLASARLDAVAAALETHDLVGPRLDTNIVPVAAPALRAQPMQRKVEIRLSAWPPHVS